jgi:hypothetical protein
VLDPKFLDLSASIAAAMVAGVRAVSPTLEIWAGEIGPHNGGTYGPGGVTPTCAGNHVCGRFGSALWYADSMAAKAAAGAQGASATPRSGSHAASPVAPSTVPTRRTSVSGTSASSERVTVKVDMRALDGFFREKKKLLCFIFREGLF